MHKENPLKFPNVKGVHRWAIEQRNNTENNFWSQVS